MIKSKSISKLYNSIKSNISEHIKYIIEEDELERNRSAVANFTTVQREETREVEILITTI